jgi:hypothetical protein
MFFFDRSISPSASRRGRLAILLAILACAMSVLANHLVVSAHAAVRQSAGQGHRVGGTVGRAWPETGKKAPRTALDRWLARQVGATKTRSCAKHWRQARRRCHLDPNHGRVTADAVMSDAIGDPGSPAGGLARIAPTAASAASPGLTASAASVGTVTLPLALVRSYQIPPDDPSYSSLSNWSWVYDSAVSAAAFAATGAQANAQQILDQLAALQHTDGSIEIAFNTATGQSSPVFRSGTVAWLGLAAATYDQAFASSRYLNTEELAANYLLSLQTSTGLIQGGPDVTWVSTQQNLIAYSFLVRLVNELQGTGNTVAAAPYQTAASAISTAINSSLLITDASGTHFLEGLNDPTQALDVQALGAMYLEGTGQPALAAQVLAYAQSNFAVTGRSVTETSDPATYNMTYSAAGPFSGYAPYAGPGAPNVIWAEGTAEMRLAEAALGQSTSALDTSIASWDAITNGGGTLQADQTVTSSSYGVQYHVWPAAVATAWTLLAQSAPAFFAAPLPAATSLVTNWDAVRGGNLITTSTNGQVSMTTGSGERRVLAGSPTASNYTITSNATLLSGAGYGVYVRATVNAGTQLTGYCVQLDTGYGGGTIDVREIENDTELSTPIAAVPVPTGFVWDGVPHVLVISIHGDTMNVTLDGVQTINIPSLAGALATAIKSSYGVTTGFVPPTAGSYGFRAWGTGLATLQQMTVGP